MSIFASAVHPLKNSGVEALVAMAASRGAQVHLVGGYVRDALLGRLTGEKAHDYDFVVGDYPSTQLADEFAAQVGGKAVLLDPVNCTTRVILSDGSSIDLSARRGGLEEDLCARDLTVNAIAIDLSAAEQLIDPSGGVKDIQAKVIRVTSEAALAEDPLRMLRAFRFAATLGFAIEEQSLNWISARQPSISDVAAERVSYELFMLLEAGAAGLVVRQMADCGFLEEIFPELHATHRVTKNAYHHLGLFDHSIEAVVQCERSIESLPEWARAGLAQPLSGYVSRLAATKLACLLHDIGKPDTWIVTPEGKHTFIGHDKLGAEMCEPVGKRLRWARPVNELIEKLVRWHLRPGHLFNQGMPTDKAVYRFFRTIEDDLPELILLCLADFRSTCGPGLQEGREEIERKWLELLERYAVFREAEKRQPRLMDGNEVMTILGIKPGPVVGEILEELHEAISLRQVQDRRQAEDFVRSRFAEKYSG